MKQMRNAYWVLRHGRSIPNETGIIISSMENGVLTDYELAAEGVHQVQSAGRQFVQELETGNVQLECVRICYSPFSRAARTAEVVASILEIPFKGPQCKMMEDLRERYFGPSFELQSHDRYSEIWDLDEKDPLMQPPGGESVFDVATRLSAAIESMELEFQGCAILIISHGDPLQILQTMLGAIKQSTLCNDATSNFDSVKVPAILSHHRKFALCTGELRRVV